MLLLSVSLVPLSSSAQRPNALPPVLRRVFAAAPTLRFSGRRTVTVLKDGRPDRHEEIVMRDGPQVRIEFPRSGAYAGQVIVENAGERRHFLPSENEVRVLPPRREEGLQRLRALARGGRVTTEAGDRVAGYATTGLLVRDAAGNPLQRLAVEPASGMVLRRQVYDDTGVEVGGFVYTRVDLDPPPFDPSLFRIERKGVQTTTPWDAMRRLAKRSGYPALGLPESTGFRLDGVRLATPAGVPVLVQNYLGPGGRLSLYQFRGDVDPRELRRNGGRRLHALDWSEGGVTFVLLGPQDDAVLVRLRSAMAAARRDR